MNELRFNGPEYKPARDQERLSSQYQTIFALVKGGDWWTLAELAAQTGYPEASISAQLRHARKQRFGGHTVEREHIANGLFKYRLLINVPSETWLPAADYQQMKLGI